MKSPRTMPMHPQRPSTPTRPAWALRPLRVALAVACMGWLACMETAQAGVKINYPGLVVEDKNLPGFPAATSNTSQYVDELQTWAAAASTPMLQQDIEPQIHKSLEIGLSDDNLRLRAKADEIIVGMLRTTNYPVSAQMRDLIFLRTLRHSVQHWRSEYLYSSTKSFLISDANSRANSIYNQYRDYAKLYDTNPFVRAFAGEGSTQYGNLIKYDGIGQKMFADYILKLGDAAISAADLGLSNFKHKQGTVDLGPLDKLVFDRTTALDWGVSYAWEVLNKSRVLPNDVKQTLGYLQTGTVALAGGGLGLALAPAQIIYGTADYMVSSFTDTLAGWHLLYYYHFMRHYPGLASAFLASDGGLKERLDLAQTICLEPSVRNEGNAQIKKASTTLCEHLGTPVINNLTAEKYADLKRSAYAVAHLMMLAERLDIEYMQAEIAARVALQVKQDVIRQRIATGQYSQNPPSATVAARIENGVPGYRVQLALAQYPLRVGEYLLSSTYNDTWHSIAGQTSANLNNHSYWIPVSPDTLANRSAPLSLNVTQTIRYGDSSEKVQDSFTLTIAQGTIDYSAIDTPAPNPGAANILRLAEVRIQDRSRLRLQEHNVAADLQKGETLEICIKGAQGERLIAPGQTIDLWYLDDVQPYVYSYTQKTLTATATQADCVSFTVPKTSSYVLQALLLNSGDQSSHVSFPGATTTLAEFKPATPGGGTPGGGDPGTPGTHPLNDTGITWSGHATSGNAATCDASHPAGQDCRYGRDAQAATGQLTKVGHSSPDVDPSDPLYGKPNGFDYTKISNSGNVLPPSTTLGTGANDWACTRDNVTGLIWEIKTTSGLRNQNHTYTWFNTNSPDGNPGTASGGHCETTGRCDTERYVQDVNTAGLCGANDWRMPTVKELEGIVDLGRTSPVDPYFFPNTPSSQVWSGSPYAGDSDEVWSVGFNYGYVYYTKVRRSGGYNYVRLVRGGQ